MPDPDNNQNRSVMLMIRTLAAVSIRISGPSKLLRTRNMGTLTVPNTLLSLVIERSRRLFDSDQRVSDCNSSLSHLHLPTPPLIKRSRLGPLYPSKRTWFSRFVMSVSVESRMGAVT
jgi:hypothetical protein